MFRRERSRLRYNSQVICRKPTYLSAPVVRPLGWLYILPQIVYFNSLWRARQRLHVRSLITSQLKRKNNMVALCVGGNWASANKASRTTKIGHVDMIRAISLSIYQVIRDKPTT